MAENKRPCNQAGCDGTARYSNWANHRYAGMGQDVPNTEGYVTKPKGAPDEYGWKCDKCDHFEAAWQ